VVSGLAELMVLPQLKYVCFLLFSSAIILVVLTLRLDAR